MEKLNLYFAQHGLAVNKTENPERPLSQKGIQQTEIIARQLQESKTHINHVFHSGKLRAAQTAEIFVGRLTIKPASEITGLSPNDDIHRLITRLQNNALYIGHLPHLDKLCNYLLTGQETSNVIKFQNSGVINLLLNKQQTQLNWYLSPGISPAPANHK